jgi:hypothetical protein
MSFLKYQDDESVRKGNGRGPLQFGRAHVDGMPFRGPMPLLKEDEYRELTETVQDFGAKVFNVQDPQDYREMKEIFDRAANGWYNILDLDKKWSEDKDGNPTVLVFVMWTIPHKELARHRAEAMTPTAIPRLP